MVRRWMLLGLLLGLAIPCAGAPATGPAAESELHADIVNAYMGCQWETLDKLLKEKTAQLAVLPAAQGADVAAIRAAVAECRPVWWERVKPGKKMVFRVSMWGRSFGVMNDPELKTNMQIAMTDGVPSLTVHLPTDEMDSAEAGEHGFSKGDLADLAVFAILGSAESWSQLPAAEAPLNEAGKMALARYLDYRGNLGGIAYTNPGGRRWGMWVFLASYKPEFAKLPTRMGREALGALFVCEVLSHPEVYGSIELPGSLAAEDAEAVLAQSLADFVEKHGWGLGEDMALRLATKQLANATGPKTYTSGLVTLPNKLTLSLDPAADKQLKGKRDAWVKERYDAVMKGRAGRAKE